MSSGYDDSEMVATDLWTGQSNRFSPDTKIALGPHQTFTACVTGRRWLADGLFLFEQPGSVNPAVDGVAPQPDPFNHCGVGSWNSTHGAGPRPIYAAWGGAQADSTPYGQALQIVGSGSGILGNSGWRSEITAARALRHWSG